MLNYLRYFYYSLRYPSLRDYVDKGIGIAARHKRCAPFWQDHLMHSRQFQAQCIGTKDVESIAVLGSGRLYDIDPAVLFASGAEVLFFDADPSAVAYSNRRVSEFREKERCKVLDVSGVMNLWTNSLRETLRKQVSSSDIASVISQLSPRTDALEEKSFHTVISLNLLSQIPLFWRDRAKRLLKDPSPEVASALESSYRRLEEAHMKLIQRASKKRIILISDVLFHYYDGQTSESEPAISVNPEAAMTGSGFKLQKSDSWMWHILPKGIEERDYGVIHEVRAWCWER